MKKNIFIFSIILLFSFNFFYSLKTSAYEDTLTVKVGYIDYDGFIEKNSDGTYEGYCIEYLNEISKYTNLKYEFIYSSWNRCMEMLKNGTIDLVCTAQYTDEKAQYYDFSKYPCGKEQNVLYVKKDNDTIYYNDYESFNNLKIGVLKNSYQTDTFKEFAEEKNFSYTPVEFYSDTEMVSALNNDKVDAIITGSLSSHKDLKIVSTFGSNLFYFMTTKGNTELLDRINSAMECINSQNLYYQESLYSKYYGDSSLLNQPLFTKEEIEFINNSSTIKIGTMDDYNPISYYDKKTKKIAGICPDIFNLISSISGLKFEFINISNNEDSIDFLREKKADLVNIMEINYLNSSDEICLSKSFFLCNMNVVSKKGYHYNPYENHTLALDKSFKYYERYINNTYPNYKIIYEDSLYDCLNDVNNGKADISFQNSYVLNYNLQASYFSDLEILPVYNLEHNLCVAALNENDNRIPILISIINKSISCLDKRSLDQININNIINKPYDYTFMDTLYKYKYVILIAILSIFIIAFLVIRELILKEKYINDMENKNVQLVNAINHAQAASCAKSDFLSRISHELRTPLNAIIGLTSIAQKQVDKSSKMNDYLDKIFFSSKMLLNIINDILDMSAIENEKMKIANSNFDFKKLLISISNIYYAQCTVKHIDFDLIINRLVHENLIGDSLRLNQILMNLLSNALKFTPNGGYIKLIVTELTEKNNSAFIQFKIQDNGCGMTPEFMERIFSPFEQESADVAQKHGGSGLGLSIVKSLVQLMNGAIKVESNVNEGTTFTVDLSFQISHKAPSVIDTPDLSKYRTLIIDDNENTCNYISSILRNIGVSSNYITSSREALKYIDDEFQKDNKLDICIIDYEMPDMNGLELTKIIRQKYDSNTIAIIISSYDSASIKESAKLAGADLILDKPLFQSSLFNLFMKLTGGKLVNKNADSEKYDFSGCNILLAEDTDFNREIAVELLEMVGASVDCAENGKEALEKFSSSNPNTYDIILMDVQMPIMDGYEATERIRKSSHPDADSIPIIAMTANAFTEDIANSLSAGMNDHVAKPIDTDLLYSVIEKYITKV